MIFHATSTNLIFLSLFDDSFTKLITLLHDSNLMKTIARNLKAGFMFIILL